MALLFPKSVDIKNHKYTIILSSSLDPYKVGHFLRPDLGPNFLQRLSTNISEGLIKSVSENFRKYDLH